MPNIGFPELLLILVVALLVFGPKRLPEVGRSVGKGLREFRKASTDLRNEFNMSIEDGPAEDAPAPAAAAEAPEPAPAPAPPRHLLDTGHNGHGPGDAKPE